jgi:threonine synthase
MDIQVSSNFERYLFEALQRDAAAVRGMMESLKQSGAFALAAAAAPMRRDFAAASAGPVETGEAMRSTLRDSGYLLDPHTACAVVALDKLAAPGSAPEVVLATAHPAKFPDAVREITGVDPPLPPRLSRLMTDPERTSRLPAELDAVEHFVAANSRPGRAAA